MSDLKPFTLALSISEMRNVLQGLELMHSKCIDNIQAIRPFDADAPRMKDYFKEKSEELSKQINTYSKIIMGANV